MKQMVYVNKVSKDNSKKKVCFEVILDIIVYALILLIASNIFKNIYIENIWYALLASTIIALLNVTIKPFLIYITLPMTILSLGLFYPIVNIIVLKLASLVLGSHFIVEGFLILFFVSIFISIMKIIFEIIIVNPVLGGVRK